MSYDAEKLYQLLPAIYRIRDAAQGEPLKEFLSVLAEQAGVVQEDIEQLYENLFIETCEEWVVPYIGDLLGARGLHSVSKATFSQRARVANTLTYRRRKGTATMLEQLARDTTGWKARAVEFFQLLATTQHLNHRRLQNHRTPDLRQGNRLELLDSPFDTAAHSADVRHIANRRGKHNLPHIGLFLWRLTALPVTRAPAFDHGSGTYSFSVLGNDAPLFTHPVPETDISHLAEEINVPAPIRLRALLANRAAYYGTSASLVVFENGVAKVADEIVACDLTDWKHRPPAGKIAVDPKLGRLAFPEVIAPGTVEVRYYYGFSGELGGGFYSRKHKPIPPEIKVYPIAAGLALKSIKGAADQWSLNGKPDAVFLIQDSRVYSEKLELILPAGRTLEIRASETKDGQQRPLVRLTDPLILRGEAPAKPEDPGGRIIFDALWMAGNRITIPAGKLETVEFRHCTLVPGLDLKPDNTPASPGQPSLVADAGNAQLSVTFERSICAGLELAGTKRLVLRDSIVAAEGGVAIAGAVVMIQESTILGSVSAQKVELASNSIFTGEVKAERRQEGCVRFCSLPLESVVPRRHRCQPNLAIEQKTEQAAKKKGAALTAAEFAAIEAETATRLQPLFTDTRFGLPGFCQLHAQGPSETFTGADDEAEMGAFHHLFQPQRESNLRASFEEFLRAGLEAGIIFVT